MVANQWDKTRCVQPLCCRCSCQSAPVEFYTPECSSGWIDPLPTWIDEIERLLQTPRPDNGSLAIYIHCQGGKDRTGEVSGSYYLRHMNITLQEATTLDHTQHCGPAHRQWQSASHGMVLHLPVRSPKVQPQLSQACGVTGESLLTIVVISHVIDGVSGRCSALRRAGDGELVTVFYVHNGLMSGRGVYLGMKRLEVCEKSVSAPEA